MAYGNYFPATYQPMAYQQQMQQLQQMQQNTPQMQQNGGFISVRSEEEARNYPVAPGNSVTFRNETAPYVYTKTMGFSQLDRPTFDKYRLVKEEEAPLEQQAKQAAEYATKTEFDAVLVRISALEAEVGKLTPKKKKEDKADD